MWNSVIRSPGARYITCNIEIMYLQTLMKRKQYMHMPIDMIPQEFCDAYDLDEKSKNGLVYIEILRGMYGIPEAGIPAKKLICAQLEKIRYFKLPHTPGLRKHIYIPISFTLVVGNFGIKYVGEEHAEHPIKAVRSKYSFKVDQMGGLYRGIELECNYERGFVDKSM